MSQPADVNPPAAPSTAPAAGPPPTAPPPAGAPQAGAPLAWEKDEPLAARWTELAYPLVVAGTLVARVHRRNGIGWEHVQGPCPRCGDHLDVKEVTTAVTPSAAGRTAAPEYRFVDVWCECEGIHPGRPEGRRGCGIAFTVPATVVTA